MVHLQPHSTLSRTTPAARAGHAQVRGTSYQLLPAAKYMVCRQLPGGKGDGVGGRARENALRE